MNNSYLLKHKLLQAYIDEEQQETIKWNESLKDKCFKIVIGTNPYGDLLESTLDSKYLVDISISNNLEDNDGKTNSIKNMFYYVATESENTKNATWQKWTGDSISVNMGTSERTIVYMIGSNATVSKTEIGTVGFLNSGFNPINIYIIGSTSDYLKPSVNMNLLKDKVDVTGYYGALFYGYDTYYYRFPVTGKDGNAPIKFEGSIIGTSLNFQLGSHSTTTDCYSHLCKNSSISGSVTLPKVPNLTDFNYEKFYYTSAFKDMFEGCDIKDISLDLPFFLNYTENAVMGSIEVKYAQNVYSSVVDSNLNNINLNFVTTQNRDTTYNREAGIVSNYYDYPFIANYISNSGIYSLLAESNASNKELHLYGVAKNKSTTSSLDIVNTNVKKYNTKLYLGTVPYDNEVIVTPTKKTIYIELLKDKDLGGGLSIIFTLDEGVDSITWKDAVKKYSNYFKVTDKYGSFVTLSHNTSYTTSGCPNGLISVSGTEIYVYYDSCRFPVDPNSKIKNGVTYGYNTTYLPSEIINQYANGGRG